MKRQAVGPEDSGSESDDIEFDDGSSGDEWVPPPTVKRPAKLNSTRSKKQNTSAIEDTAAEESETDDSDVEHASDGNNDTADEDKTKDNFEIVKELNRKSNEKFAQRFHSGTFIVKIQDLLELHENDLHPVWKIDGSSLLQKFTAFHEDGKVLHRSTQSYAPWNSDMKDKYYPVYITFVKRSKHEVIIELYLDKLKKDLDSVKTLVEENRSTNSIKDDDNKSLNK